MTSKNFRQMVVFDGDVRMQSSIYSHAEALYNPQVSAIQSVQSHANMSNASDFGYNVSLDGHQAASFLPMAKKFDAWHAARKHHSYSTNHVNHTKVPTADSRSIGAITTASPDQGMSSQVTRGRANQSESGMLKLVHVTSPYAVNISMTDNATTSFLYDFPFFPLDQTQNVTIASMIRARENSFSNIGVSIYCAVFPEEAHILPDNLGINKFHLTRSTQTVYPSIQPSKKLPFVEDIFRYIYDHVAKFDYIIYTNIDIGLHESFYNTVAEIIETHGFAAFTVNRRSIPRSPPMTQGHSNNATLITDKDLDLVYAMIPRGAFHPGKDCFVIRRDLIPQLTLGSLFLGFPPWGKALDHILKSLVNATQHHNYKSDLNVTFHLGNDLNWHEGNAEKSVVVDNKMRDSISACPPIQWKLQTIRTMTPYRLQNTKNCAALFAGR